MKYRVSWKSTITGATGHGKWSTDKDQVQSAVDQGNQEFPELNHWLEEKE